MARFLVQTLLGARSGLVSQTDYEGPTYDWVEYSRTQWLKLDEWSCPLDSDQKFAVGLLDSS